MITAIDASHRRNGTMLRQAKNISPSKATDIRLGIDAAHAPWGLGVSNVEMLDLIKIQVGDHTEGLYTPGLIISTPRSK
jgi:hypothetical protein